VNCSKIIQILINYFELFLLKIIMSEQEELLKAREKKEKLEKNRFKQQTLPAWRPVPTLKSSLITFFEGSLFYNNCQNKIVIYLENFNLIQ
jgi:hypothetical protein